MLDTIVSDSLAPRHAMCVLPPQVELIVTGSKFDFDEKFVTRVMGALAWLGVRTGAGNVRNGSGGYE